MGPGCWIRNLRGMKNRRPRQPQRVNSDDWLPSGAACHAVAGWYNAIMPLSDFPEVRALSAREKLQLVDELWVSVAPELEALGISAEEKRMLDERWAAFLKDPASALTLDDFRERLKACRP